MRNRRLHMRRLGLTLVELIVVIAVILTIAALAAAFLPNISNSNRVSTSVDLLEQWLLTAKMRAKRDGLPTGIRFIADANTPGQYAQFVYIQQPDPLVGGTSQGGGTYSGGFAFQQSQSQTVSFGNVDFSGGQSIQSDFLVLPGDYLEMGNGGGVHLIQGVTSNALTLSNAQSITNATNTFQAWSTSNYRILRQPRQVLGENPLQLPGNMVVDINQVPSPPAVQNPPPPNPYPFTFSAVSPGVSGQIEILFAPSGAVIGSNAGAGTIYLFVRDYTLNPADTDFPGRCGIVAVQTLTGYIGAYNSGTLDTQSTMNAYVNLGRDSGM